MCLKTQSPWPMPEETGRIGKGLLGESHPYQLMGDQLFEKWKEEEFADLYSSEGKPGYSPVILAFVSVFQFREGSAGSTSITDATGLEVRTALAVRGYRF